MIHPRDQWFRVYVYTPGKAGPVLVGDPPKEGEPDTRRVEAGWIERPTWGPESETEHLVHPDAYHPDPRVRIAHHRNVLREGFAKAGCGHVHDPRMKFIETEGKPEKPCAECRTRTDSAVTEHQKALVILEAKAAAHRAARTPAKDGEEPRSELPEFELEEPPTGH